MLSILDTETGSRKHAEENVLLPWVAVQGPYLSFEAYQKKKAHSPTHQFKIPEDIRLSYVAQVLKWVITVKVCTFHGRDGSVSLHWPSFYK